MIEEPPSHQIQLRGAGAELWAHLMLAINEGVEPPLEWVAEGRAGTGKSFSVFGCLIAFASLFPKIPGRILIARLTRRSLTTSSCVTIRKLLYPEHPMLQGARDDHRTSYWLGRWEFVLAGLDNADNLLSTEWDFIFGEETRQFPKGIWEELSRGLRNHALYKYDAEGRKMPPGEGLCPIPFGMLLGATNPWTPKHWILKRAKAGKLTLVHTTIDDNPAYIDLEGNITPEGVVYERRGDQWTGTRYKRLKLGLWCAAEGIIYEEWVGELEPEDPLEVPNVIRIPRPKDWWIGREAIKALDIVEFYCGVDFGDDAPGCLLLAGLTKKHRKLIVLAEVYARKKDLDWWESQVRQIHEHYPITLGFCDHGWDSWCRAFNDVVGAPREGPGQVFVNAQKDDRDRGIQITRLRIARKTLLFDVDALMHPPDASLVEAGIPTCAVDEIPDYVHKRDEDDDETVSELKHEDVPDPKCHDHGCDAVRYLCTGVDYFDPAERLAEPLNKVYRDRLLALRRRVGAEYVEPEDVTDWEDDADDRLVDTIRKAVWGDD